MCKKERKPKTRLHHTERRIVCNPVLQSLLIPRNNDALIKLLRADDNEARNRYFAAEKRGMQRKESQNVGACATVFQLPRLVLDPGQRAEIAKAHISFPRVVLGRARVELLERKFELDMDQRYEALAESQQKAVWNIVHIHKRLMSKRVGRAHGSATSQSLSQLKAIEFPVITYPSQRLATPCEKVESDTLMTRQSTTVESRQTNHQQRYSTFVANLDEEKASSRYSSRMDSMTKDLRELTSNLQMWVNENLEEGKTDATTGEQVIAACEVATLAPALSEMQAGVPTLAGVTLVEVCSASKQRQPQTPPCPKGDFEILLNAYKPKTITDESNSNNHASCEVNPPVTLIESLKRTLGVNVVMEYQAQKRFLPTLLQKNKHERQRVKKAVYGTWYVAPARWNDMYVESVGSAIVTRKRVGVIGLENIPGAASRGQTRSRGVLELETLETEEGGDVMDRLSTVDMEVGATLYTP